MTHVACDAARRSPRSPLMMDRQLTELTLTFTSGAPKANNTNVARGCLEGGFRQSSCLTDVGWFRDVGSVGLECVHGSLAGAAMSSARRRARGPERAVDGRATAEGIEP